MSSQLQTIVHIEPFGGLFLSRDFSIQYPFLNIVFCFPVPTQHGCLCSWGGGNFLAGCVDRCAVWGVCVPGPGLLSLLVEGQHAV
jgi:hypothetical protein